MTPYLGPFRKLPADWREKRPHGIAVFDFPHGPYKYTARLCECDHGCVGEDPARIRHHRLCPYIKRTTL